MSSLSFLCPSRQHITCADILLASSFHGLFSRKNVMYNTILSLVRSLSPSADGDSFIVRESSQRCSQFILDSIVRKAIYWLFHSGKFIVISTWSLLNRLLSDHTHPKYGTSFLLSISMPTWCIYASIVSWVANSAQWI